MTIQEMVEEMVGYHQPTPQQVDKITNIRIATETLIIAIAQNCPECADRSAAIRKAREAMMTANAAIVVPQHRI